LSVHPVVKLSESNFDDSVSENGSHGSHNDNEEPTSMAQINEKELRAQLPKTIIDYSNRLKVGREFKGFTQRVCDAIWNHFSDENQAFEQVRSNRPLPGFDQRRTQIKQAQGALSRIFNQITTPIQLSQFIRDYVSVLKTPNSVQSLNQYLRTAMSEHQNRGQEMNFIYRFCALQ